MKKISFLFLAASAVFCFTGCSDNNATLEQGIAQMQSGQFNQAIRTLKAASKHDPRQASIYSNMGIALWKAGKQEKAKDAFAKALVLSNDPLIMEYYGRICLDLGEIEEAQEALKRAIALSPSHSGLTAMGAVEIKMGNYSAATNYLASALAIKPDYQPALFNMAVATGKGGGINETSRYWAYRYLETDPNGPRSAKLRSLFSKSSAESETRQKAIDPKANVARKAEQTQSTKPDAHPSGMELVKQAKLQADSGNEAEVEKLILKAVRLEPKNPDILLEAANIYENMGQKEKAASIRSYFKREFPADRRAALFESKQTPTAKNAERSAAEDRKIQNAASQKPKSAADFLEDGLKKHKAGDYKAAIDYYNKALALDQSLVNARYNLGLAYRSLQNNAKAIEEFKETLKISPNRLDARYMLAVCLRDIGESKNAITELKEILKIDNKYANAHLLLGIIYRELGKIPQARESLKNFISLDPQSQMASQAREWLKQMD